ncbi:MAG: glycosyltransferase family 4 protein [Candidatus Aminicenantaceae bacterium]
MKVSFIGQKGIPISFGGVEFHVDRIASEMVNKNVKVTAYVRSWYTNKKMRNYKGVKLIHIYTIRTKHLDASIHSFLSSLHALFSDSDIIHYHCIGPAFFSFIPRLFGKKVVVTIHRLDWNIEKWGKIARFVLKTGEYISTKIPHRTIVVSTDVKKYIENKYHSKVTCISQGTEIKSIVPANVIKKKYGLKGRDYILYMGRLSPEKRIDWVIKAYQSLKVRSSRSGIPKLVIAGGSSATDRYVKKLKEMSRDDPEIVFTGYVRGIEKEELLSQALVFIMASVLEGFPIALIEAQSYGNCCLVSDIPPHRDAIRDRINGVLFKTEDFSDITKKLQWLVDDPEKTKVIGKRTRESIGRKPGWDKITDQILNVYRQIL